MRVACGDRAKTALWNQGLNRDRPQDDLEVHREAAARHPEPCPIPASDAIDQA